MPSEDSPCCRGRRRLATCTAYEQPVEEVTYLASEDLNPTGGPRQPTRSADVNTATKEGNSAAYNANTGKLRKRQSRLHARLELLEAPGSSNSQECAHRRTTGLAEQVLRGLSLVR